MTEPVLQVLPKTRKTDQINWALIIATFLSFILWLIIFLNYFLAHKPELAQGLADVQLKKFTEQWMGFYQAENPIGYNHLAIEPRGDEYFLTDEMVLRLNLLGEITDLRMFMKGKLNLDWTIKELELEINSSDMSFSVYATRSKNILNLLIRTGGQRISKEITLTQPPYLYTEPVLAEKLRKIGLAPGTKLSLPVFEPLTQTLDYVHLEVREMETLKINNQEVSAFKVSEEFRGQTEYLWITEDGEVVKEYHPSGFSAIKINREQALELLSQSTALDLDLLSALVVEADRYIENSRTVKYLKAKILGPKLSGLDLDGDNQKLLGRTLEIKINPLPYRAYQIPYPNPDMEKYLQPDLQAQSDAPEIIQKAKEITEGEVDAVQVVKKLTRWTSKYVEDSLVVTIPTALEVLNQKKGACKEHTVLFTALARSLGIPTRMVAGLVYSDNYLIKGFYYHAWAEVYLTDPDGKNGRWLGVDPTFEQFPIDATHIRLKSGALEDMVSLMQIIGQTKIEVIDYQ